MTKFIYEFIYGLAILTLTSSPSTVFAWGATAHRAIGEIAEQSLTENAKHRVKSILQGQSLASVSTWADEIRSDPRYDFSKPWHFVEIPIGTKYDPKKASPKGDLITQIQIMLDILKGRKTPLKMNDISIGKVEALKFLVHFIGDLHQPLHIGNGRDRGGHLCQVKWFGEIEHGNKLWSLHSVWDDGLFDSLHLGFTELSRFILEKKLTAAELKKIKKGSPIEWAGESQEIQSSIYPDIKHYTAETPEPAYCKIYKENRNETDQGYGDLIKKIKNDSSIPSLEYNYRYQVIDGAKERLRAAGLRLAMLLNSSL